MLGGVEKEESKANPSKGGGGLFANLKLQAEKEEFQEAAQTLTDNDNEKIILNNETVLRNGT